VQTGSGAHPSLGLVGAGDCPHVIMWMGHAAGTLHIVLRLRLSGAAALLPDIAV